MKYVMRKSLHEYRAFIVDMDGTLYFQFPVRFFMAIELLVYYMLHLNRMYELKKIMRYRKNNENGMMQESDSLIDFWMIKKPLKYIHAFRDVRLISLLSMLQQQGKKIVVYSDYPVAEKLVSISPFKSDFYFCASDSNIQCIKPDPKGLSNILKALDLQTEDVLFIGDRYKKDGKCAEAAGMDYVVLSGNIWGRKKYFRKI